MSDAFCILPHDTDRLAQDGHYLCPGHVKALPERFRQLHELHNDLAANLIRQGTPGERVTSSRDGTGIVLDANVTDVRDLIRRSFAGWAGIVSRDTGHLLPDETLPVTSQFLLIHADWISRQEWVSVLWAELVYDPDGTVTSRKVDGETITTDTRALRTRARSLLQPTNTRHAKFPEHRCLNDDCTGYLVAVVRDTDELLPSKVWCESCGQEWPAGSWLTLGRKLREREAS